MLKPFILKFAEVPDQEDIDLSQLSYSTQKNLTVISETGESAVNKLLLSTETFSKSVNESSDTDYSENRNLNKLYLSTMTKTAIPNENTDSDLYNDDYLKLRQYLSTKTLTEAKEVTDKD